MLDLYFWTTPNGYKVTILLEELGLGYNVIPIHIGKGEQFDPNFLKISPNNKIPALVDHDASDEKPIALFESGAIMMYLAEKSGWRFMPADFRRRYYVVRWLMFQMGGLGPMLGQAHYLRRYAKEQVPYAIERYTNEATRLYRVLDRRLREAEYLAGEYSIADMAVYPWLRIYKWQGQDIAAWPNLQRWYSAIRDRPAVQRGVAILRERAEQNRGKPSADSWDTLFGRRQYEAR
jgi:GSH-dependent disulfide-bond oxidoreductase